MLKPVKTWHHFSDKDDIIASQYCVDDNGLLSGECRTWNQSGVLETRCIYEKGKVIGTKSFYSHEGKVIKEIDYDFDGCPFVIRFFADERTEEQIRAIGLAQGFEGLTLDKILSAFEEVKNEAERISAQNFHLNQEKSRQAEVNNTKIPNLLKTMPTDRVTFT